MYKEAKYEERIQYYDVTSLYPYINKTGKASPGHPEMITEPFDIANHEGLIKCKIIAPCRLILSVVPAKINKWLIFALCNTRAKSQQKTQCQHNEEVRDLIYALLRK